MFNSTEICRGWGWGGRYTNRIRIRIRLKSVAAAVVVPLRWFGILADCDRAGAARSAGNSPAARRWAGCR